MVEQQFGKGGRLRFSALVHSIVGLRNYRGKESGMTPEAVAVHRRSGVHIGAPLDQPLRDVQLIVVRAHVEQGGTGERRSVCRQHLVMTA